MSRTDFPEETATDESDEWDRLYLMRGAVTIWAAGKFSFIREVAPFPTPFFTTRMGLHTRLSFTRNGKRWILQWR